MIKIKWMLLLFLLGSSLCSVAQIKNKETYRLIAAYLNDSNNTLHPYWLEEWSLPFNNSSNNIYATLNASNLENGLYWGGEQVRMDSLFSEADFKAMREKCIALPGRYKWNKKKLHKLGIPVGDTSVFHFIGDSLVPPTIKEMLQIHARISPPLFSLDKKKAIFYAEYHSEHTGGEGNVFVYIKEANRWTYLRRVNVWID